MPLSVSYPKWHRMISASAVRMTKPMMRVMSASPAIRDRSRRIPFRMTAAPNLRMRVDV